MSPNIKSALRILSFGFVCAAFVLSFQNCGAGFEVSKELSSNGGLSEKFVCGATETETFSKTYYPLLRTSCAGCHVSNGLAPSAFSSADLAAAFSGFQTATAAKIIANGSNPLHGGGAGKAEYNPILVQAQTNFDGCKSSQNPVVAGAITARTAPVIPAATATAKIITINLDSQLELGSTNLGGAQFQFSIRTALVGVGTVYIISNPSLRTVSSTVQVKGFKIKINGISDPLWTAFSQIDRTINAGAQPQNGQNLNGNLAVGNGTLAVPSTAATDTIQFEFETLKVP